MEEKKEKIFFVHLADLLIFSKSEKPCVSRGLTRGKSSPPRTMKENIKKVLNAAVLAAGNIF